MKSDREVLQILKRHKVRQVYAEPIRLSAGGYSTIKYDVEKLYEDSLDMRLVAKKMYDNIGKRADVVISCGGAIPLATTMALDNKMKLTILEKHYEKPYERRPVHGHTPVAGQKAIIIDDVGNTYASLKNMFMDSAPYGVNIVAFGLVIDRNEEQKKILLGTPLVSLVNSKDLDSLY